MEWGQVIVGALSLGGTLALGFFAIFKLLLRQNAKQTDMFTAALISESAENRKVINDNTAAMTAFKAYLESGAVGKVKKKREDL